MHSGSPLPPTSSVWRSPSVCASPRADARTSGAGDFDALACPQCGGPLPRQALWRMVTCPHCRAIVTRGSRVVERRDFHAAWLRSRDMAPDGHRSLRIAARDYRVLAPAPSREGCQALSAISRGPLPERVVIELAEDDGARLAAEAQVLGRLQQLDLPASPWFSQRLPQLVAFEAGDPARHTHAALVTRRPAGFSESLAEMHALHPAGLRDPRHVVWLWRRVLEVLAYVHDAGWTHGDLRPAHWLVDPRDHGVLLTGWARARRGGDVARDLRQSAWTIRALLQGHGDGPPRLRPDTPAPLAALLRQVSEDAAWCARQGAAGIDHQLSEAARQAFGRPRFVPFHPLQA